jgi:hypothetical protein
MKFSVAAAVLLGVSFLSSADAHASVTNPRQRGERGAVDPCPHPLRWHLASPVLVRTPDALNVNREPGTLRQRQGACGRGYSNDY